MRKGFTLVELSIVLVIIGLLIGGILVAQSMISTSKNQALVRQLGQFDVAVNNFNTAFGSLPGDSLTVMTSMTFMTGASAGLANRDGILNSHDGTVALFSGEMGSFWNALSLTGLTTKGAGLNGTTYVQSRTTPAVNLVTSGAGANIPVAVTGPTVGFVAFSDPGTATNWYAIVSTAEYTGSAFVDSTATNAALKPIDALAVDTKVDDGVANTGNVRGGATSVAGPAIAIDADCGAAAYLITVTTPACVLAVRMGASGGVTY